MWWVWQKVPVTTAITKPHTIVIVSRLLLAPRCIDRKPAQDVCTYHIVICLTPNLLLSVISSRAVKLVCHVSLCCLWSFSSYWHFQTLSDKWMFQHVILSYNNYYCLCFDVFCSIFRYVLHQTNKKKMVTFTDLLFKISSVLLICGYSLLRLVRNWKEHCQS